MIKLVIDGNKLHEAKYESAEAAGSGSTVTCTAPGQDLPVNVNPLFSLVWATIAQIVVREFALKRQLPPMLA